MDDWLSDYTPPWAQEYIDKCGAMWSDQSTLTFSIEPDENGDWPDIPGYQRTVTEGSDGWSTIRYTNDGT